MSEFIRPKDDKTKCVNPLCRHRLSRHVRWADKSLPGVCCTVDNCHGWSCPEPNQCSPVPAEQHGEAKPEPE